MCLLCVFLDESVPLDTYHFGLSTLKTKQFGLFNFGHSSFGQIFRHFGKFVSIITTLWMTLTNNLSHITIFPHFHECESTSENEKKQDKYTMDPG